MTLFDHSFLGEEIMQFLNVTCTSCVLHGGAALKDTCVRCVCHVYGMYNVAATALYTARTYPSLFNNLSGVGWVGGLGLLRAGCISEHYDLF